MEIEQKLGKSLDDLIKESRTQKKPAAAAKKNTPKAKGPTGKGAAKPAPPSAPKPKGVGKLKPVGGVQKGGKKTPNGPTHAKVLTVPAGKKKFGNKPLQQNKGPGPQRPQQQQQQQQQHQRRSGGGGGNKPSGFGFGGSGGSGRGGHSQQQPAGRMNVNFGQQAKYQGGYLGGSSLGSLFDHLNRTPANIANQIPQSSAWNKNQHGVLLPF